MRVTLLLLICFVFSGAQDAWKTYYEKSGYLETPRYEQTVEYCKMLADSFPAIQYRSFGTTPQGRDLPLLIVDKDGLDDPQAIREKGRIILMLQAGIHSGEIDGKDAGFIILRDMFVYGKNYELLDNVSLLFIPIFNVDGHERFSAYSRANQNGPREMGWRATAQNYNLNRDYLKADAPEMRAWLKLFNDWLPEFFIDSHVTDGADYPYVITFDVDLSGMMAENLVDWSKNNYIPFLKKEMKAAGFPTIEYVNFRKWNDPRSGLQAFYARPRYSTGYVAIQNRVGLLIETHMFKPYRERVEATRQMVLQTMRYLNRESRTLSSLVREADRDAASAEFRQKPFALTYKLTKDSTMVDFWGYEFVIEKSDISGGPWFRYSNDTVTWQTPFFNSFEPENVTTLPVAYLLPPEWLEVAERLRTHGIEFWRLEEGRKLTVGSHRFEDPDWSEAPWESRHYLSVKTIAIEETRTYPAGTIVIPMGQRSARVAAHILEPEAPDSYVFWGFFDSVFEVKEYVESYVMEERARVMLASDAGLKKRFEQKMANDSTFASDPRAILFWFYRQSPFWDDRVNKYPVGKIFDEQIYQSLK